MIGYGPNEQESFALELTYNYGINYYERGNDLRYIVMSLSSYKGPLDDIEKDYNGRMYIQNPDGHWIYLIDDREYHNKQFNKYVNLTRLKCKKLKVKVLELQGVVFSQYKERI
jgi:hypothetical protein